VLLFSILTLAILPAVFYYGAKFFGFIPSQFSNSIIQAAMPLAITPFALADKYNLNKDFIARSIVLSTILAVVSLPFWISILTS
ncbi:MAG: AEC family transporter, partial [Patescibacteria group bacterium]